jgi:hypothetical protein
VFYWIAKHPYLITVFTYTKHDIPYTMHAIRVTLEARGSVLHWNSYISSNETNWTQYASPTLSQYRNIQEWINRGIESRQGLIFLYTTASRPALGCTQPPIQWVSGALSLGGKAAGVWSWLSPPYSAKLKDAWSYTSTPPIRLHSVVLS